MSYHRRNKTVTQVALVPQKGESATGSSGIKQLLDLPKKRIIAGDPSHGSIAYYAHEESECMNCGQNINIDDVVIEDLVRICLGCAIDLHLKYVLPEEEDQLFWFMKFAHTMRTAINEQVVHHDTRRST